MAIEYSDEDFDQDLQQDIAAAAAQAAGINMDSYDFGGFDSGGSDFTGASNQGVVDSIVNSYMDSPTRTGMAIRESFPMFKSPRSGLNQFANLYTSRRGPMSRSDFNSLYDISRTNTGGIDTLGYDTAKALQRVGIGSGQVKTDPNVGRLTGTVFGKKNELGETVLMSDGKSMGIDAGDYYSGKSGSDVGRPDLETYQDKYGYADPTARAINRAYDQYLNPYNDPSLRGYNRDIDPNFNPQAFDLRGQVRPGLQSGIFGRKDGTPTALGPIATYDRNYSGMDNIAMGVTGGMGMLARALTNKVTGIAGQPLPQDAMAPTPEMMARGETYGGLGRSFGQIPGQAVQGFKDAGAALRNVIDDFTTPNVPGVSTSSLDFMPRGASPDLAGFEQRFGGTNPLSGETTVKPSGSSIVDGKTGFQTETLPDGSVRSVQTTGGMTKAEADEIKNYFEDTKNLSADEAAARAMERLENPPQFPAAGNYGSRLSGEQLAGGFGIDTIGEALGRSSVELSPEVQDFLDEHGMSVRDLMDKDFSKVPDGARLPSGQIMGPEFRPNQTPPAPATDLQQLIRDAVSSRELGGPSTANQLAFDSTNMVRSGDLLTSKYNTPSTFDKIVSEVGIAPLLRSMGMKIKKGPSAQIYSKESPSFFSRLIGAS
tara:strand:+ start:6412 stop:8373 length:1962 start_codon:yes stop_codon:yes gene_type:complete